MTRSLLRSLTALILAPIALLCAMARPWPAAAQPAVHGRADTSHCTFRRIYDAARVGTMPLVRACDAALVAGAFREAGMPIEVAPPNGASHFTVMPSGGQSVPSLPVIDQWPDEGQPLPKPPPAVDGVYARGQKLRSRPPLISLATATPPSQSPSTPASPVEPSSPVETTSPVKLSVNSDKSAAKADDTIAFTVAAHGTLPRPASLTYVISDPASCAPPARQGTPLLLRPEPGSRTIHYHICLDSGNASARTVTFTVASATDDVTLDPSSVSVTVAPAAGPDGATSTSPVGGPSDAVPTTVPSWLWWAIGGGGVLLAIWRLTRRDPSKISDTEPPISATCALDIGTPVLGRATPPVLPSATLRVRVDLGRPAVIGPEKGGSDG